MSSVEESAGSRRVSGPGFCRQSPLACAQLRVRIAWWHWWGRPKTLLRVPIRGRASSSLSPGPQGRHHLHTAEEPRAHWGVWEGPLRGRSGVPRPAVWIHGTWPIFPNFPLATTSTTRVLPSTMPSNPALLTSPPSRHSTLTVHPPPPPLHLEDILPATYPSLSGSSPGRHVVGPGPSRHACLGTRDGSSPTPRKQLPQIKLTGHSTVCILPLPILGPGTVKPFQELVPPWPRLLSTSCQRRRRRRQQVWRSRFTDDQDAADAHASAHALHTTIALLN